MAKVITNKKINLFQLDQELGSQGLSSDENDPKAIVIVTADGSTVTEAELDAAIKNHVAVFVEQTIDEKLASVGLSIGDLKAALGL